MEITFGTNSIIWTEDEQDNSILLKELDPSQLIHLLEKCVSHETNLKFLASKDISPFSKKLKELIESAFLKSDN